MASNIEALFALVVPEPEVGVFLDLKKLAYDVNKGFRVSVADRGVSLGKVYVVTRLDDDLFQVELESNQVEPFGPADDPYYKCAVNITRSKGLWRPAIEHPVRPVLERWAFRFGSQIPTEHTHFPNTKYGGNLDEEEFLKRFNTSLPDHQATEQLMEYLQMIHIANGQAHWNFNWISEEQPKLTQ